MFFDQPKVGEDMSLRSWYNGDRIHLSAYGAPKTIDGAFKCRTL